MFTTKSVFIGIGIIVVLVGMATGCSPRQALCDLGAPWCQRNRL